MRPAARLHYSMLQPLVPRGLRPVKIFRRESGRPPGAPNEPKRNLKASETLSSHAYDLALLGQRRCVRRRRCFRTQRERGPCL
jgi:hypothetical protein